MIYELLENFDKALEDNHKLVEKAYTLKEGIYVRISENTLEFFKVKKEKSECNLYTQNDDLAMNDDEDWFKQRDYISMCWDINKPVFKKQIHNINFLTLFFKLENFDLVRSDFISQIDVFKNFARFKKNKENIKLLNPHEGYIKRDKRQNLIEKASKIYLNNFDNILKFIKENDIKKGSYVKIFLISDENKDEDIKNYYEESKVFFDLKIYNDNIYNTILDNEVLGLSNFNMGMNSKKPFLGHKDRLKEVPYLINQLTILKTKKFFDWLACQNKANVEDFSRVFLIKFNNNAKAVIKDYDYIPIKQDEYEFEEFNLMDFMKTEDNDDSDIIIKDLKQFRIYIDEFLYQKRLIINIFKDDIKGSKYFQNLFYSTRDAMVDYFYKYDKRGFDHVIEKYDFDFIRSALKDETYGESNAKKAIYLDTKKAINMIFSIKYNKKGEKMDLNAVYSNAKKALNSDEIIKLEANEYYFLAGQLAMFLMNKSKSARKTFALAEPYLKARTIKRLKDSLAVEFLRYKHEVFINYACLKRAFLLVQNRDDENISTEFQSLFLAGMMAKTLIKRSETEVNKGENNE